MTIHYIWASMRENLPSGGGGGGGEQQRGRPACATPSLISAFVIRLLESIIFKLATSEISIF